MEKSNLKAKITSSLENLNLNSSTPKSLHSAYIAGSLRERAKRRSLMSLCLGVLGQYFEDISVDLDVIAANFPSGIKMALLAIARRRNLLNDDVLIALVDNSWDILDISGSQVSDSGLAKVAEFCNHLRALDISRCSQVTSIGVTNILSHCHSLEVLRWGGCSWSNFIAQSCLTMLKPKLNSVEGESWEELDSMDIANNVPSLRWLVWPRIDDDSKEVLATECPRILVNPEPSPFGFRGVDVPHEALPNIALDDPLVEDIDRRTWAACRSTPNITHKIAMPSPSNVCELPMAERFRLAFVERDTRLAPKRAKNARQHRRRAEREWMMSSTEAKSMALASQASKFLHKRS